MPDSKSKRLLPGKSKAELATSKLPLPDRDSLGDDEREAFDYVLERSERFFNSLPSEQGTEYRLTPLFQGLLQSPKLAELWAHFGDFYQTSEMRGSFTNRERDVGLLSLVPLLTNARTGQIPLSPIWVTWAVGTGVTPEDIKAILEARVDDLSPDDRQLFEFVRAVATGGVTGEMFDRLSDRMGVKTSIEFISFVTWRIGLLRTIQAHWGIQDLPSDNSDAYKLLDQYLAGEKEPEDYNLASSWVQKQAE